MDPKVKAQIIMLGAKLQGGGKPIEGSEITEDQPPFPELSEHQEKLLAVVEALLNFRESFEFDGSKLSMEIDSAVLDYKKFVIGYAPVDRNDNQF